MVFPSLIQWPKAASTRRPKRKRATRSRLEVESLEDRIVPASTLYFNDVVGSTAVDSAGDQYVYYSQLHGIADLSPAGTSRNYAQGTDYTTFNDVNGRFLVKYSPTHDILWMKSDTDLMNSSGGRFGRALKVATDSTGEHLYAFGQAVTKMDLDGNVIWSKDTAVVGASFVDTDGSIYVSGTFQNSADLDPGTTWSDNRDLVTANGQGMYVAKWDANGTFQWSQAISADVGYNVWSNDIAAANGIVYASGYSNGDFTIGGTSNPADDFLAAFDTNGSFQSAALFSASIDHIRPVGNNVYITANFGQTTDMDPGPGQTLLTPAIINGANLAVAALTYDNSNASSPWTLQWAEEFVGGENYASGLAVSGDGNNLYISGEFGYTTDFDPTAGTYNLTANGGEDFFAMKLSTATGNLGWVSQLGSEQSYAVYPEESVGLVLTPDGIYLGGYIAPGTIDFVGPGGGTPTHIQQAGPNWDAFVGELGLDGGYQWSFVVGARPRAIDDGDTGYTEAGGGWNSSTSGYGGDSRTHRKGDGSAAATWTFTGLPNATYQVMTSYPASGRNASDAPFLVNGSLVTVNEQAAPSDLQDYLGGAWASLGTATVTNGTLTVTLSDAANGMVVADVVRIVMVTLPGPPSPIPSIGSLTASPDPVSPGQPLTLTANNVTDDKGVTEVDFYRDDNRNGTLDVGTDTLLGTDTNGSDGWSTTWNIPSTFATGTYTYFAQAADGDSNLSAVVSTTGTIQTSGGGGGHGHKHLTASALGSNTDVQILTAAQVQPLLTEAISRFATAGFDVTALANVQVHIRDLGGTTLGEEDGNSIFIDDNAAGWGWFVDPTPGDDSEFTTPGDQGEMNHMDLLSAVEHELGHVLGLQHTDGGVMSPVLAPGERLGLAGDWEQALFALAQVQSGKR